MKKNLFMWLSIFMLAAVSLGFTSCGDDDDDVVPAPGGTSSETQPTEVSVQENTPEGVEAVDLGLPSGTKWANMNIGATSQTDFGTHFAWGETEKKSVYGWSTYLYGKAKGNVVNIGKDIAGTKYDAARMKWGGDWKMPTDTQIRELLNNTTSEWRTMSGVKGMMFFAENGNWIFLPASGFYEGGDYWGRGTYGDYWSSTVNPSNAAEAFLLEFLSGKQYAGAIERCQGCAIRPVISSKSSSGENDTPNVSSFTVNGVQFKMVAVEGGTFQMGSNDGGTDEQPVHSVTLSSYYIGQTEVTQALWEAVMGTNPSYFKGKNLPVERVSWSNCVTFITKLKKLTAQNFRLLTEAEWEYAARGGRKSKGYRYAGSNNLDAVAWWNDRYGDTTHPVATKQPNELGLYDMSGNVKEWCQDMYNSSYYSSSPSSNPGGPSSGRYRVIRGGGWDEDARAEPCRSTSRHYSSSDDTRLSDIGFRLAL